MRPITVKEIEYIAYRLAKELLQFNEPIPDFTTRYPGQLESCLAIPFIVLTGGSPYPGFIPKASTLFYLMIKNHPFQNGNKRIAITTLLVFLLLNGKWLKVDLEDFYQFTVWIAGSPSRAKDATVLAIEKFISDHVVNAVTK